MFPLLLLLLGGAVVVAAVSSKGSASKKSSVGKGLIAVTTAVTTIGGEPIVLTTPILLPEPRRAPYVADGYREAVSKYGLGSSLVFLHKNDAYLPTGTLLPKTSPDGYPWLAWQGTHSAPFDKGSAGNLGIDANGTAWTYTMLGSPSLTSPVHPIDTNPVRSGWRVVGFEAASGFINDLGEAFKVYVLPAIAVAAGIAIPGPGGVITAAVLTQLARIANGARIDQALLNATRDALPGLMANDAFQSAYDASSSLYTTAKNLPAVQAAAAKAKASLLTPGAREAYDQGVAMAVSGKRQEIAIAWLKSMLPSKAATIDLAMAHGGVLEDVARVLGGRPALSTVQIIVGT